MWELTETKSSVKISKFETSPPSLYNQKPNIKILKIRYKFGFEGFFKTLKLYNENRFFSHKKYSSQINEMQELT